MGRGKQLELIYTPTHSSSLNRIECQFGPLKRFALNNAYYDDHLIPNRAIQRYINWRNSHR